MNKVSLWAAKKMLLWCERRLRKLRTDFMRDYTKTKEIESELKKHIAHPVFSKDSK